MVRIKKIVLSMVVVLSMCFVGVGCGKYIPTDKDVDKAHEKYMAGKMTSDEYYEIYYANIGQLEIDKKTSPLLIIGAAVIVVAGAGTVVYIIKKRKETKEE